MEEQTVLEETEPAEQTAESAEEAKSEPDAERAEEKAGNPVFTVPVKYNKQKMELTVQQAATLAQKGMKFDEMKGALDKLSYLSAAAGMNSEQLLDSIIESKEKELADRARKMAGDDDELFARLMELEHGKQKNAYERFLDAQRSLEDDGKSDESRKIAEEFLELKKEFPEIAGIADLPEQVLRMSAEKGVSLLDGYLRYRHRENAKIKAASEAQKTAADSSTGSLNSKAQDADNITDAFLKGIWK